MRGHRAKADDRWLENDHQVPDHVAVALAGLLAHGLMMLLDPDPMAIAQATLTDAGADRYERLRQQALRMPGAQFIDLCRRFVDEEPGSTGGPALPD